MTLTDLREVGFPRSVNKMGLVRLLVEKYPDHEWKEMNLLRGRMAQQKHLELTVRSLFKVVCIFLIFAKEIFFLCSL